MAVLLTATAVLSAAALARVLTTPGQAQIHEPATPIAMPRYGGGRRG